MKEDRELVTKALTGGAEAFRPIVERYQDAVFGVALSRLWDFHEAEDVAQQVFVKAFQRLASLRDPARLGAWLRSMTVNCCIDLLRRRKEYLGLDHAANLASSDRSPDDNLEREELRHQVMGAISKLPRKQRETVTLFYINGYSVQDIATMEETPVGSIKRRLHDARGRLTREMHEMVESTLKAEAPKDDFAKRVFELLCRKGCSEDLISSEVRRIVTELRNIGAKGVDGLVQALQAPDWQTRLTAALMIRESGVAPEPVVDLLKQTLADANQNVRSGAVRALLSIEASEARKRQEFLPLIIPLLADPTRRVRFWAAMNLRKWAADIPLEAAARALAKETGARARRELQRLVLEILEVREHKDES